MYQRKRVSIFVEGVTYGAVISVEPHWKMDEILEMAAQSHNINFHKGSFLIIRKNHARISNVGDLRDDDELVYINAGQPEKKDSMDTTQEKEYFTETPQQSVFGKKQVEEKAKILETKKSPSIVHDDSSSDGKSEPSGKKIIPKSPEIQRMASFDESEKSSEESLSEGTSKKNQKNQKEIIAKKEKIPKKEKITKEKLAKKRKNSKQRKNSKKGRNSQKKGSETKSKYK